MRTFLLDTCIWSYWFDAKRYVKEHANIRKQLQKLAPNFKLGISIITWGEVAFGQKIVTKREPIQEEYLQFIKAKGPKTFDIDIHTANKYGELRSLLFDKYAPKDKRKKNLRPEQLIDPITSLELGIQENDLWIAAQAVVRNLTLVTNDKLARISEVAGDDLHIENWTA
jgi:predicted nucleic acid-binding protein